MKKILFILLATLVIAYIGVYFYFFADKKVDGPVCEKVEIVITDSLEIKFLTEKSIVEHLTKAKLYPLKKKWDEINTFNIKEALLKNEIIETVEVVRLTSGQITIKISQKMPVLRVFNAGGSYFVDKYGQQMTASLGQAIDVPLASGNIEKSFAASELYKFALFLQNDAFWNDQITQIYVRTKNDIEIIPRVGNHHILLGSLDDFEKKLSRLRLFYEQVIPKMGWEKYNVINLKFKNQIVCTKK